VRLARAADTTGAFALYRIDGDIATPIAAAQQGRRHDPLVELLDDAADVRTAPAIGDVVPLADLRLSAPITAPSKIIAIGLNYADHARESGLEAPAAPISFCKFPSSIVGPEEAIRFRTNDSAQVDYEVELAAIIGRRARDVPEADALSFLLGYTVCNDVSARDAQFADGQWVRGKCFDTFCPLGPWIVTADEVADPQDLGLRCRVNGEVLQDSSTKEMIFGVAELVSYLSRFMTLEPGDVIATGTPFGVGFARTPPVFLGNGDVVECEVDGIGTLRNPVVTT
jgi:2-keto-4-pentenoate hydratase/2-oxohepta-3-ene-1,7-dioic acid hydratase in catechol pathway